MLIGIVGNVMKQNAIFPPPEDPDYATEEEAGRREWREGGQGRLVVSPAPWPVLLAWPAQGGAAPTRAHTARLHRQACLHSLPATSLPNLESCLYTNRPSPWPIAILEPTPEPAGPMHPLHVAAGRNFVRGVLLAMLATFAGILLFSFPEYVQQLFKVTLPIAPGTIVSGD